MSCYNAYRRGYTRLDKKINFRKEPCRHTCVKGKAFGFYVNWCSICYAHYNKSYPDNKPMGKNSWGRHWDK